MTQDLGDALDSAWKASEGQEVRGYAEWEYFFLSVLETTIGEVLVSSNDASDCACLALEISRGTFWAERDSCSGKVQSGHQNSILECIDI